MIRMMMFYVIDRVTQFAPSIVRDDPDVYETLRTKCTDYKATTGAPIGDTPYVSTYECDADYEKIGVGISVATLVNQAKAFYKEATPLRTLKESVAKSLDNQARPPNEADQMYVNMLHDQLVMGLECPDDADAATGPRKKDHSRAYCPEMCTDTFSWRSQMPKRICVNEVLHRYKRLPLLHAITVTRMEPENARFVHRGLLRARSYSSVMASLDRKLIDGDTSKAMIAKLYANCPLDEMLETPCAPEFQKRLLQKVPFDTHYSCAAVTEVFRQLAMLRNQTVFSKYVFSPVSLKILDETSQRLFHCANEYCRQVATLMKTFDAIVNGESNNLTMAFEHLRDLTHESNPEKRKRRKPLPGGVKRSKSDAPASRSDKHVALMRVYENVERLYKSFHCDTRTAELTSTPFFLSMPTKLEAEMPSTYDPQEEVPVCRCLKTPAPGYEELAQAASALDSTEEIKPRVYSAQELELLAAATAPVESEDAHDETWMLSKEEIKKKDARSAKRVQPQIDPAKMSVEEMQAELDAAFIEGCQDSLLSAVLAETCDVHHSSAQKRAITLLLETLRKISVCLDFVYMHMAQRSAELHQMFVAVSPWALGNGAVARHFMLTMSTLCVLPGFHVNDALHPKDTERYATMSGYAMQQGCYMAFGAYAINQIRDSMRALDGMHGDFLTYVPRMQEYLMLRDRIYNEQNGIETDRHPLDWFDDLHAIWARSESNRTGAAAPPWGANMFQGIQARTCTPT